MTRSLPPNWRRTDLIVAAVLAFVGALMAYASVVAGIHYDDSRDWRWLMLGAVVLALPILLYRRHPVPTLFLVTALYITASYTTGVETYSGQVVLYLAFYSVGAWEQDRTRARNARATVLAVMIAWLLIETVRGFADPQVGEQAVSAHFSFLFIQWVVNAAFFGAAWAFGERAWASAMERQHLEDAHEKIRAQQDVIARSAVEAERFRIARELHDTVAHHVTVMGVQSAAARRSFPDAPAGMVEHLRGVESSSRQAVEELRAMVHTLRDSTLDSSALPGIADIPSLVDQAHTSDQVVTYEVIGEEFDVTAAIGLTAFRVVQESLSNTRRHAGPVARVKVTLRYLTDGLEVEIADDGWGQGAPRRSGGGTGTGVQGMVERVQGLGGTITAGPTSRGGWLVRASIPVYARTVEAT